jgi:hypothetical protein
MSCKIYYAGDIIEVTIYGLLTGEDLKRIAEAAGTIEGEVKPSPDRITDMSGITGVSIDFPAMDSFASERTAAKLENPVKSAIVAVTALQYGFAQMFSVLMRNPQVTVSIFRDTESARQWLRAGPSSQAIL